MAEQLLRRSLELIEPDAHHYKFWSAILWDDHTLEVCYGRIGTQGQTQIKRFKSDLAARSYLGKKLDEKFIKGYEPRADDGQINVTAAPPAPSEPEPTQDEIMAKLASTVQSLRS